MAKHHVARKFLRMPQERDLTSHLWIAALIGITIWAAYSWLVGKFLDKATGI